jgi:tetratricopeptide (TPR) repeat protein
MSDLFPRWRRALPPVALVSASLVGALAMVSAQSAPPKAGKATAKPVATEASGPMVQNSALDARLFYDLLLGEMELRSGSPGGAFQVLLDAARRTRDEGLFRRSVEIAVQSRAGDEAVVAAQAWRTALPNSLDAMRTQLQLMVALNRIPEAMEPLGALLQATPLPERPALIAAMPRSLQRAADKKQAAALLQQLLKPSLEQPATRTAARVALGRMALIADDPAQARTWLQQAQQDDPASPGPALLALEMLGNTPEVEPMVARYLEQPNAEPQVRLAYVRQLAAAQRYKDAAEQAQALTRQKPELAPAWLTLGALRLELKQPAEAEQALQRYVQLAQAAPTPKPEAARTDAMAAGDDDDDDDDAPPSAAAPDGALVQAWLLLSQAAEQRGDYKAAEGWLQKVDSPQRALEVQSRRAAILARQGKVNEARELLRKLPERAPEDAKGKLLAEAQMLRDVKRWKEAGQVMATLNQRYPDEPDLLYEQAMVEEKLDRMGEMERLLRKVIALKPDYQHAYNALGYSLADRNKRLPEAKALIEKALALSPNDPFITDSLGWVQFRMGNRPEALALLRKAYVARPDSEIAAHLAEVLWVDGQRDEARRVLREAKGRDGGNETLTGLIARLKVDL